MHSHTVLVFIFLAYFTLYNGLQFYPSHYNLFKCILFNGWVMFHCVNVPQLSYPFVYWWASRLLPCPGYDKQCCDEHWSARLSFSWFPRCVCPGVGLLGHMAGLLPVVSILFSIVAVLVCIPTNSVRGLPFLHTLSSIYTSIYFKGHSISKQKTPIMNHLRLSLKLSVTEQEQYSSLF